MEEYEIAERVIKYALNTEKMIHDIDKRFERIIYSCAPSGYVGCSQESRGSGDLRRTSFMSEIGECLTRLGQKKDRAIITLKPIVIAFERLKHTRSGHVIYWQIGKGLSTAEYGEKFNFSRRHARRLYIKAMQDLYTLLNENGGENLIEKFSE